MSKLRKFKMATILSYGKNKLSTQMSSDGLNLPTVHPPPPSPHQMPCMEKNNRKNSNELNVNTLFHRGSFFYIILANTNLWVRHCDR